MAIAAAYATRSNMNIGDTLKSAVHGMPTLVTGGKPGYRAGDEKLAWANSKLTASESINVSSAAFGNGEPIPLRHSADGENAPPPLSWSGVPQDTQSIAVVAEDPDAPTPEPFVHWLVYNLPPNAKSLPSSTGLEGKNSKLTTGWTGMAPPKGDSPHRYVFQVFALDKMLPLQTGAGRTALFEAMTGHVLARGRLIGTYQR
jgi:Raf kinase inhibitor-like YbhB/YbcL family protein